eukprot:g1940.t1
MKKFAMCKEAPFLLLMFQSGVVSLLMRAGHALGLLKLSELDAHRLLKWLPLNVLFVLMLMTGLMSLGYVAIPMVTLFKNLTNVLTVTGDRYFFGQRVTAGVVLSLSLMLLGALLAAASDLSFSLVGYTWMTANCVVTSAYILAMRLRTRDDSLRLTRVDMVHYNNVLSIALCAPFAVLGGDLAVISSPAAVDVLAAPAHFLLCASAVAVVGALLNLVSYWCVHATSATTYTIVGALNKVPAIILSIWLFQEPIAPQQLVFVSCSMLGGFVYSCVKISKIKQSQSQSQLVQKRKERVTKKA